jgi:hypothetical protein
MNEVLRGRVNEAAGLRGVDGAILRFEIRLGGLRRMYLRKIERLELWGARISVLAVRTTR